MLATILSKMFLDIAYWLAQDLLGYKFKFQVAEGSGAAPVQDPDNGRVQHQGRDGVRNMKR